MKSTPIFGSLSVSALIACYALIIYTGFFFYPRWEKSGTETTLSWDTSGYYFYLPAIFIYKDIKQIGFKDEILQKYYPTPDLQQAFLHEPSGNYVMKYTIGQAITMSPFFFAAHLVAKASSDYPPDGFSYPYQVIIGIGMLLYTFLGLYLLRKILRLYFSEIAVALVLIAIVFGSNYLSFAAISQAASHSPLFAIYTLLIYVTIKFYRNPSLQKALAIGLLCGLASLIRPTEIISVIIPLGWGISSVSEFKDRLNFIFRNLKLYIPAIFTLLVVGSIQLFYWKYVTGSWIVYSYQDQGFSWLSPHIYNFSLSYQTGWLRYSPIMFFAFIGIIPFVFRKQNVLAVISFFLINFYIVTAWDIWDYGGTGGRAMIQSYPILAFPIASLIEFVNRRKLLSIAFYSLFLLFIYISIWAQFNTNLNGEQMLVNKEYFWQTVGKWKVDDSEKKLLDNPHSYRGYPKKFEVIYEQNFDTDTSENSFVAGDNNKALFLDADHQFTKEYGFPKPNNLGDWIRVSADFKIQNKEWDKWMQTQFIIKFYNNDHLVQSNFIRVHRFLSDGESRNIYLDAKIPEDDWNRAAVVLWNATSSKRIEVDNLKVITFDEPKE